MTAWVREQVPRPPQRIVDLGAGTGTGSLALARRFALADVVAVDRSASMLDRVTAAAAAAGLDDRVSGVPADLDEAWPALGAVDLVWAASTLHEVANPDRLLGDVRGALEPGGLLVVIEMDGPPRFLPDTGDLRELEERCHAAIAAAGWNAHPDWHAHLERAGLEVTGQRTFDVGRPAPPSTGRYAHAYLRRVRAALTDGLSAEHLEALDHLLEVDAPLGLTRRTELTLEGTAPPGRHVAQDDSRWLIPRDRACEQRSARALARRGGRRCGASMTHENAVQGAC